MLEVRGLIKTFAGSSGKRKSKLGDVDEADVRAIDDVSFTVEPGEMFTLLGPSGCGKSTTLRSIAGLERPDSGEITIGERVVFSGARKKSLPPNERQLSMVFQSYAIWPHMNVFDNVAFPLQVRRRSARLAKPQIQERVEEVLEAVHLGEYSGRPAVKLSGGQQQRLALARAIVTNPDLILLDEPLSNLDAKLRESMRIELKRLQRSLGLTSVYVTHDQGEALALSSRVAVMNKGRIVQLGRPREIYESPNCRFVAEFIGSSNIVTGTVREIVDGMARIDASIGTMESSSWADLAVGDEVAVMIRPEDLELHSADAAVADRVMWAGRIEAGAYAGEAVDYVVTMGTTEFRGRASAATRVRSGTEVLISVDPNRVHVLPPERSEGQAAA